MQLTGKVALITGGASGIGRATAELMAERGAQIVIADLSVEDGTALAQSIRDAGGVARFVRTDVSQAADVVALMETVRSEFGRIDIAVFGAGVLRGAGMEVDELGLDQWHLVQNVNLNGMFLSLKYGVPLMKESGGVILCIASGAGVTGPSSSPAYGASKGGVNGLAMTVAPQLAPYGIRINVVCPGNIVTPLKLGAIQELVANKPMTPDERSRTENMHLNQPIGVARVLAFLASDEADYVRGNIFTI